MRHHGGAIRCSGEIPTHSKLSQLISSQRIRPRDRLVSSTRRDAAFPPAAKLGQPLIFSGLEHSPGKNPGQPRAGVVKAPPAPGPNPLGRGAPPQPRLALLAGSIAVVMQLTLLPPGHASAREWYVEAELPPSVPSPQPAWRSFAQIDWASVSPGDTIHILGDACGPPYREALIIGGSGTSLAPLVISGTSRSGTESPVIDGENRREAGVVLQGRDHVIIRGLTIRNHADAAISIQGSTAGVIIEENNLFSGDPGGGNARGIDARQNRGENPLIVRRNQFGTPESSRAQTDGIYSMNNDGVLFEENSIIISNSDTTGHSDAFQSFQDKNIRVRGNWFEQANTASSDNHGVWMSNGREGGTIDFSENIVLAPNLVQDSAVTYYRSEDWAETASVNIQRNAIIGGGRALNLADAFQAEVHGNLIAPSAGGIPIRLLGQAPPAGSIDGNLVWAPAGVIGQDESQSFTRDAWRQRGYDTHGTTLASHPAPHGLHDLQAAAALLPGYAAGRLPVPPAHAGPPPEPCPTAP